MKNKEGNTMKLANCTKDELIFIIDRLRHYTHLNAEYYLERALNDLKHRKEIENLEKADKYAKIAHEKRKEYCELLKPYEGKKLADIPCDVLSKANRLIIEARKADEEWEKLIGTEATKR